MNLDPANPGDRPVRVGPIRVLFLCSGNSARSQIAEALLGTKGGSRFVAASAGAHPAVAIQPQAITALRAAGIDWSNRHPKGFEAIQGEIWDLVITLCDRAKEACPALPGRPVYAHWSIPDPGEADGADRTTAFDATVQLRAWRIELMLALRPEAFDQAVLEERLRALAFAVPDSVSPLP